jgi:hypothetical protein
MLMYVLSGVIGGVIGSLLTGAVAYYLINKVLAGVLKAFGDIKTSAK